MNLYLLIRKSPKNPAKIRTLDTPTTTTILIKSAKEGSGVCINKFKLIPIKRSHSKTRSAPLECMNWKR